MIVGNLEIRDFEVLFKANFNRLCNKVFQLTHDKEVSRDIVQEVFLKLWVKRKILENVHSKEAYLYQSVIYHTLNYCKQQSGRIFLHDDLLEHSVSPTEYSPEELFQHKELQEKIEKAIDKLPQGCRRVFLLNRYEQMSYSEIANHLSLSINSVEKHMGRALKLLREHLHPLVVFMLFL